LIVASVTSIRGGASSANTINGWSGLSPLFDQATEFKDICLLELCANAMKESEEAKNTNVGGVCSCAAGNICSRCTR